MKSLRSQTKVAKRTTTSPAHLPSPFLIVELALGALIVVLGFALKNNHQTDNRILVPPTQQQCTLEAKICPDGTAVGRTGPNCQFAACPAESSFTTPDVFAGNLPCADCSALSTVLKLSKKDAQLPATTGSYSMKQIYVGRDVPPLITTGNWVALEQSKNFPQNTIYQLDPDKPDQSQYFLQVNANTLQMLDSQQQEISAPFPLLLKRVTPVDF